MFALLQAVDYEAKHRKLQNLRLAGTGDWLFQHAKYVEWETSGAPHFFVAAVYVSFIECYTTELCLHCFEPAVVKAS